MHREHHTTHQLQQLLERGYSADDLRATLNASDEQVERALSRHRETIAQRQRQRSLHSQATYAMRLLAR
jgi:arsenate reductase-like glutaredoxin family protein